MTLYFAVRSDIGAGRSVAQAIHAMDEWAARYGAHQGPVVVYGVRDEAALLAHMPTDGRVALFREPDFGDEATAFATDVGPMPLRLLGRA